MWEFQTVLLWEPTKSRHIHWKPHLSMTWLDSGKGSLCNNNFTTLSFAKNSHRDKVDCPMVCEFWKTFKRVEELLYLKQPPANCQKCQHLGQFFAEVHVGSVSHWSEKQCRVPLPTGQPAVQTQITEPPKPLLSQIASRCSSQLSVVLLPLTCPSSTLPLSCNIHSESTDAFLVEVVFQKAQCH